MHNEQTNRQTNRHSFFIYIDAAISLVHYMGGPVASEGLIFFGKKVTVGHLLDVKRISGKFGCICSYGVQTHSEQTDRQTDRQTFFFIYI